MKNLQLEVLFFHLITSDKQLENQDNIFCYLPSGCIALLALITNKQINVTFLLKIE